MTSCLSRHILRAVPGRAYVVVDRSLGSDCTTLPVGAREVACRASPGVEDIPQVAEDLS